MINTAQNFVPVCVGLFMHIIIYIFIVKYEYSQFGLVVNAPNTNLHIEQWINE